MTTHLRNSVLLAGVVFSAVSFGLLLVVFGGHTDVAVKSFVPGCLSEIQDIQTTSEAFDVGQSYFGGTRGYDLMCARAAYNRSITLNPEGHYFAWHQLGRIDFLQGDFDHAIFKFEKQIEYFSDKLPNVHYMLGLTYGYRARDTGNPDDWENAEEEFARYLELDPHSPWVRVDLAWVLFSQGKYADMKPILEVGLAEHLDNAWLLNMYGLALLNTEERESATIYFMRALTSARTLTPEQWGTSYPGNDPEFWPEGLEQMVASIEKNLELTMEAPQ